MLEWVDSSDIPDKRYVCGFCGSDITSNKGYYMTNSFNKHDCQYGYIYICHNCNKPSYITYDSQTPGSSYGKCFKKEIFNDNVVYELYNEVRNCIKINAYTSVGMCCRKLLMHIAVDCGAAEGKKFAYYVDYLDQNNYIPSNCKRWVDIIRNKGNEANHEIIILEEKDAKQLIQFIQIIISVIYEMPYQANLYLGGEDNE